VSTVELVQVIEAAIDAVRPAAEAKNMRLEVLLDPQVEPIPGDADRLQQVVWNLLTNAVKFTPKGGRVQVRLERINSHVELTVSDSGKGIESEFLPHVFDRFRQADQKSTRTHGGLGLGLSIVRQLVELHGGSVHAKSEGEGQGATFVVQLPLMVTPRGVEQQGHRHPTAGGNMELDCPPQLDRLRILVVDDEDDTRDLLRTVLEQCGAEVVTAGSAMEALEALKKSKPDVLISDIGMPEDDGYALISKVRALSAARGGKVPAIALTAYARTEDRVRALMAGFQVHLSKPIEPVELVTVVASLVGRTGTA
jgi:CheY-like chemotaxis protein